MKTTMPTIISSTQQTKKWAIVLKIYVVGSHIDNEVVTWSHFIINENMWNIFGIEI